MKIQDFKDTGVIHDGLAYEDYYNNNQRLDK